jgi:hypothetical protein
VSGLPELSGIREAAPISKTLHWRFARFTNGVLMDSIRGGARFLSVYLAAKLLRPRPIRDEALPLKLPIIIRTHKGLRVAPLRHYLPER